MILHSIISPYDIFCNSEQALQKPVYRQIKGGMIELDGERIKRLISTDPKMYLDTRYTPGAALSEEL